MQNFKNRWEINQNWQLIFPLVGIIGLLFSGYLVANKMLTNFSESNGLYLLTKLILSLAIALFFLWITLKIFKKLEDKWEVSYRWELIAIFIVFAITGSTSAKISDPILSLLGLSNENTATYIYWPLRIILIFPIYQILLIVMGWLFGQFSFFWQFEKKMLSRLGFSKFFKE
ncbi:DUF6787 family protein [Aquimarina sp. W85]|uniref:DUF6787 family protein n=1 Tax=Aquimarina rhodophyticola TaxID=3342246 RepID=UPI00366D7CF1